MAKWNKAQQEVLDSLQENRNILVSAAAGSGKTAVLVERIIRSVTEGRCHMDEILVVTFTRAAAAEMKTRILSGLAEVAEKSPTKEMYRELSLADSAEITTIDSFCNSVVRENFHLADVDPSFQIYDSEEAELVKDDVMRDVFDRFYREDEEFRRLSDYFISNHISDSKLRETISAIDSYADGFASPESWLSMVRRGEGLDALTERQFRDAVEMAKEIRTEVEEVISDLPGLLPEDPDGINEKLLGKLMNVFADDRERLTEAALAADREGFVSAFEGKGPSFPQKDAEEVLGQDKKKELVSLHKKVKEMAKAVPDPAQLRRAQERSMPVLQRLLDVTDAYRAALAAEKKRNRRYEFNDIGHFAWKVLSGHPEVAERYRSKYKYIYIDEYQDSNDLQENILGLCARRDEKGMPCNIFMVGDVKQSIYRFRQARPELFMEKEAVYGDEAPEGRLIRLNRNYRSRKMVLDSANVIFRHVMSPIFGGILYDEAAYLHAPEEESYREHYPEAVGRPVGGRTELFLIRKPEEGEADDQALLFADQAEAYILAREIRKMIDEKKQLVRNEKYDPKDPSSDPYRPAEYRDIVVLMRSVRGCSDLLKVCEKCNVPVRVEDRQGYFDAEEVVIMLSLLSVLDNHLQDIPFASVLLSPIFQLTEEELALVMTEEREKLPFAVRCRRFAENRQDCPEESLRGAALKLKNAFDYLARWEKQKNYLTIAELLDEIWADTGFKSFVAAMPEGGRRLANLNMLSIRAEQFEGKGRKSLFDFIRYIDKCRVNDIDFGEARVDESGGNVVRIMTMHSSKGLEFPIVFLMRLGRQFMTREKSDNLSFSRVYGLGMHIFETWDDIPVRTKSELRNEIHRLEKEEMLAEEARLLYVAMTRPKERLIMIGKEPGRGSFPEKPTGTNLKNARCMLDYIIPVILTDPDAEKLIRVTEETLAGLKKEYEDAVKREKGGEKLAAETLLAKLEDEVKAAGAKPDPYFFWYEKWKDVWMRSKLSVSEVKHAAMPGAEEKERKEGKGRGESKESKGSPENRESKDDINRQAAEEDYIPEEIDITDQVDKEEIVDAWTGGALRGTVIHRIMELLPFTEVTENAKMEQIVRTLLSGSAFTEEERNLPALMDVTRFYSAEEESLFQRMRRAEERGCLRRESQFTAGVPAKSLPALGTDSEERVVIQGVIDAWFKEKDREGNDHIVIVDYKTDRVKSPAELADRYRAQLELYKMVVESLTHIPVTEMILFSTIFGEVPVR